MDCLHFIGGKRVPSRNGRSFENVNPATEEILGTVAEGGAAEVDLAVEAATKASRGGWKQSKLSERAAILRKIGDLILQRKDELAKLETLDTGKPLWLAGDDRDAPCCRQLLPSLPTSSRRWVPRHTPWRPAP